MRSLCLIRRLAFVPLTSPDYVRGNTCHSADQFGGAIFQHNLVQHKSSSLGREKCGP